MVYVISNVMCLVPKYKLLSCVQPDDQYVPDDTYYVEINERDILSVKDGYVIFSKAVKRAIVTESSYVFDTMMDHCAWFALHYAIDNGPSERTRISASQCPISAYRYAVNIDGYPTITTLNGVKESPHYNRWYSEYFGEELIKKLSNM